MFTKWKNENAHVAKSFELIRCRCHCWWQHCDLFLCIRETEISVEMFLWAAEMGDKRHGIIIIMFNPVLAKVFPFFSPLLSIGFSFYFLFCDKVFPQNNQRLFIYIIICMPACGLWIWMKTRIVSLSHNSNANPTTNLPLNWR